MASNSLHSTLDTITILSPVNQEVFKKCSWLNIEPIRLKTHSRYVFDFALVLSTLLYNRLFSQTIKKLSVLGSLVQLVTVPVNRLQQLRPNKQIPTTRGLNEVRQDALMA